MTNTFGNPSMPIPLTGPLYKLLWVSEAANNFQGSTPSLHLGYGRIFQNLEGAALSHLAKYLIREYFKTGESIPGGRKRTVDDPEYLASPGTHKSKPRTATANC